VLDQKHNEYIKSIYVNGKVTPSASQTASDYRGVQREIVRTENISINNN
tara:strand:+ start:192 stop:338 length:147 start_codon:yes stop_codon:yes gene_type:complete